MSYLTVVVSFQMWWNLRSCFLLGQLPVWTCAFGLKERGTIYICNNLMRSKFMKLSYTVYLRRMTVVSWFTKFSADSAIFARRRFLGVASLWSAGGRWTPKKDIISTNYSVFINYITPNTVYSLFMWTKICYCIKFACLLKINATTTNIDISHCFDFVGAKLW